MTNPDRQSERESAARRRLADFCDARSLTMPARVLDDDDAFADELCRFCDVHDLSLDWLWLGDPTRRPEGVA